MKRKLILDVDTGSDDACAIMLAALHNDLDLVAVCSVSGNVPLENTTENTLRVLQHIGKTKIPVKLDKDKHYQIAFIIKNREGSANRYQVVFEHDMSRNIMKEIGITNVPVDF